MAVRGVMKLRETPQRWPRMKTSTSERIGARKISEILPQIDSHIFSACLFRSAGLFVVRGAIPATAVAQWQSAWREFYLEKLSSGRSVNRFNPVAVDECPPQVLADIHRNPALLDIVEEAFGPDIALYNQRFVIKDAHSRGPVFLHQDFPYHLGWPTKASAFVPLTPVFPENGGMVFYPGTHQFGYLGDAGEINPSLLGPEWPMFSPSLEPGDVVLMNSLTWHSSGPHTSGPDRVLVDVIYQPADDPSGVALLRGKWKTEIFLNRKTADIFSRSRVSRLIDMQRELDARK